MAGIQPAKIIVPQSYEPTGLERYHVFRQGSQIVLPKGFNFGKFPAAQKLKAAFELQESAKSHRRTKHKRGAQNRQVLKSPTMRRKPYARTNGSVDYRKYLKSPDWERKRSEILLARGECCEICSSTFQVQVHHETYDRLGRELDTDLKVLCRGCHENEHEGKVKGVVDPMTAEYLSMFRP